MKRLACAIMPLLLAAGVAVAGESRNRYENTTIGFEVTKPKSWHFQRTQRFSESLNHAQLSGPEFRALLFKFADGPLVSMTKYAEPYTDLNPALKISVRPFGKRLGEDATQVLGLISGQFAEAYKDYELVQAPTDGLVSGIDSAYMRVHYTVRAPYGRMIPAASEIWVVPQSGYFYLISSSTRQDEATGTRAEIREIIKTTEFVHAAGHT